MILGVNMNLETIEKEEESISSLVSGVYSELQDLHAGRVAHKGLLTGFADLDEITTGLNKGELIVIAGRPSMGKDVFAKQIVGNVALRKGVKPHIAIFSLERTAQQWLKRMFSIESRVNFSKFMMLATNRVVLF
jgi:replicative DNA helicase